MNFGTHVDGENVVQLTRPLVISGDLGSGKSSVAQRLAEQHNVEFRSTGDLHRSIALERNITTLELNRIAESDESIDREVDGVLASLAHRSEPIVIDSRMAWRFIPHAISVHLTVLPTVGAERVRTRAGLVDENYKSVDDATEKLRQRAESERSRFSAMYNVDSTRLRNYDLVIDTSGITTNDAVRLIGDFLLQYPALVEADRPKRIWMSPRVLFPTQGIRELTSKSTSLASDPIEVGYSYPFFFIVNGHHRVRDAIVSNRNEVQSMLLGEDGEDVVGDISSSRYFSDSVTLSRIHDWNIETNAGLPTNFANYVDGRR